MLIIFLREIATWPKALITPKWLHELSLPLPHSSKKETVLPVQPHQLYQAKNINAKITIKSEKKRNTVFAPFAVFIASTKTDAQWLNLLYAVSCIAKCHFPF